MTRIPENAVEEFVKKGFLRISLDKSTGEAVNAAFKSAYIFFRETLEEKTLNELPEDCGYRPFGVEYSKSPDSPDQIESFTASRRLRNAGNKLPTLSAQQVYEKLLILSDRFEAIAETLIIRLRESLGGFGDGRQLEGALRNWSRLQLNYSRPTEARKEFINETHEDGVLITITCATGAGLELETESGRFSPAIALPGEVLLLAGDIIWLLTGGLIKPKYHRVRSAINQSERLSLVFLGDIDPKLCQPWVVNEVNENVDIGARVLASASRFGLQGFSDGGGGGEQ